MAETQEPTRYQRLRTSLYKNTVGRIPKGNQFKTTKKRAGVIAGLTLAGAAALGALGLHYDSNKRTHEALANEISYHSRLIQASSKLASDYRGLQGNYKTLDDRFSKLQGDYTQLQAQNEGLASNLKNTEQKLQEATAKVADLEARCQPTQAQVPSGSGAVQPGQPGAQAPGQTAPTEETRVQRVYEVKNNDTLTSIARSEFADELKAGGNLTEYILKIQNEPINAKIMKRMKDTRIVVTPEYAEEHGLTVAERYKTGKVLAVVAKGQGDGLLDFYLQPGMRLVIPGQYDSVKPVAQGIVGNQSYSVVERNGNLELHVNPVEATPEATKPVAPTPSGVKEDKPQARHDPVQNGAELEKIASTYRHPRKMSEQALAMYSNSGHDSSYRNDGTNGLSQRMPRKMSAEALAMYSNAKAVPMPLAA